MWICAPNWRTRQVCRQTRPTWRFPTRASVLHGRHDLHPVGRRDQRTSRGADGHHERALLRQGPRGEGAPGASGAGSGPASRAATQRGRHSRHQGRFRSDSVPRGHARRGTGHPATNSLSAGWYGETPALHEKPGHRQGGKVRITPGHPAFARCSFRTGLTRKLPQVSRQAGMITRFESGLFATRVTLLPAVRRAAAFVFGDRCRPLATGARTRGGVSERALVRRHAAPHDLCDRSATAARCGIAGTGRPDRPGPL